MHKPTDTGKDQTTGGSNSCHIYPKCHEIMDALQRSNEDLNSLFNIAEALTQSIRYQQMYIYLCTILAYLRDSLTYIRQVAIHTMDYVGAATTNILSPEILFG